MMHRQSGKIVSIASVAGVIGVAGLASYSAAKAGVIGFTRALAKEVGPYGINVNCVSPGPIMTEGTSAALRKSFEKAVKTTYLGRAGKPEEIASLVVYLVSDEASFITGQNHMVCGGRSLGW
jgi:NAD(P)-dependent dehydrogenase (short-subunit alcohol dehydrogenase family)